MTFERAMSELRQMMLSTGLKDEELSRNQVLRDLIHIAQTAGGTVAVDAYAISMAIGRGPDLEEGLGWEMQLQENALLTLEGEYGRLTR